MLKRFSAVGLSCVTAILAILSAFAAPSTADAASLEEMAAEAIRCITSHEGSYGSVNPNDCGAVSVGKLQWHADRALYLMRDVCNAAPEYAVSVLGESFYNEIQSVGSWNYRTLSASETSATITLLGSEYGISVQDATALSDVQGYIVTGQNMGLTDSGSLVLYADIYNFGCGIAARVAKRAASYAGSYAGVTLDQMYQAALNDSYGANRDYVSRANNVYNYLCSIGWNTTAGVEQPPVTTTPEEPITTTPAPEVTYTEEGAGAYLTTASVLNMRSGAGTGYSIVTQIPYGSEVQVTLIGDNNWAAVTYGSYTGYCSMDYLVKAPQETTTEAEETTTTTTVTTTVTTETETTTEEVTTTTEVATTTVPETTATTESSTTTTTEAVTTETEATTTEATTEEATTTTSTTVAATETSEVTTTTTLVRTDAAVNPTKASLYGDVNCDGYVNVTDALILHKYLLHKVELNDVQLANADCATDQKITSKDVTVIFQHLLGNYTALPIL